MCLPIIFRPARPLADFKPLLKSPSGLSPASLPFICIDNADDAGILIVLVQKSEFGSNFGTL